MEYHHETQVVNFISGLLLGAVIEADAIDVARKRAAS